MDDQGSTKLMNNIIRDYVRPEVDRRAAAGTPVNDEVWAAQIVFEANAPSPTIRINSEVKLRAIPVGGQDLEDYVTCRAKGMRQFAVVTLAPDEENIKHMTMCQTSVTSSWRIFFSLGDPSRQAQPPSW